MVYSASMVAATKGTLTGGVEVWYIFYNRQLIYVIMSFIIVFYFIYDEYKSF